MTEANQFLNQLREATRLLKSGESEGLKIVQKHKAIANNIDVCFVFSNGLYILRHNESLMGSQLHLN